jgi:putative tryptophan/tyrosine transport system substrate-binding protein
MVSVNDPIRSGFIANLARPGGNITGLTTIAFDLSAKFVELFVELIPGMKLVGVVRNPSNPAVIESLREIEDAVRKLNMQVQVVDARSSDEFEHAFARLSAQRVNGVVLIPDTTLIEHARRIAELAQAARLPTAFQRRENVEAGGLMSYGANIAHQFRQAAFYVDRLLKGAKPPDLPVEQPTKFEFVINLKTARVLGLELPPSIMLRADEVIA